jgi:hypothetical protein
MIRYFVLIAAALISSLAFLIATQALLSVYNVQPSVAWGLSVKFGYVAYFLVAIISVFSWRVKKNRTSLLFAALLFFCYLSFWTGTYAYYPKRTLAFLAIAFVTYALMHIYLYKEKNRLL